MSDLVCLRNGCIFQIDFDGEITCTLCGSKDDSSSDAAKIDSSGTIENGPNDSTDIFESQIDFE